MNYEKLSTLNLVVTLFLSLAVLFYLAINLTDEGKPVACVELAL